MADPLPLPPPPADASWRERFDYAVAMQRHDDMVTQTAAIAAQSAQSAKATDALTRATDLQAAIADPTDADRWWQAVVCQIQADDGGFIRDKLGLGWIAGKADDAMREFRQRFPA